MSGPKKFLFVGDRYNVLNRMLKLRLEMSGILCPISSYASKQLDQAGVSYQAFSSKKELLTQIRDSQFDILVSNGCPYILPVSQLKKKDQEWINIHPSALPDLRGKSPISGAIQFNRPFGGASCHIMDDLIDNGPIISRVSYPITPDLDLDLLYRMTFDLEPDAFELAWKRNFQTDPSLEALVPDPIFFSRTDNDRHIRFSSMGCEEIQTTIRAYALPNHEAFFQHNNKRVRVLSSKLITNPFLLEKWKTAAKNQVIYKMRNAIVIQMATAILKLTVAEEDLGDLAEGTVLD